MSSAPLPVPEQLVAAGELMFASAAGMLASFVLAGACIYLFVCLRSSRQWNGLDQRWEQRHR